MTLIYKPERKIPHKHIILLEPILSKFKDKIYLVGSYRRKTPYSRDLDIMLVSDDIQSLDQYLSHLAKLFDKKIYVYSNGADKMSLIVEVPAQIIQTKKSKLYKMDIFRAPKISQHAMLLYATGSKLFNIKMRARAKRMGYLLNQHGLYKGKKLLKITSEEGFFKKLDMPYVLPEDRN